MTKSDEKSKGEQMESKAERLKREGLELLNSPSACLLPKPVRNLIADLLALVHGMGENLDEHEALLTKCKAFIEYHHGVKL